MSELHFDNEGEPAEQHAQCAEVRWRRFRNPGMRGAPEVVHEKDGSPLYTNPDTTYLEFRARVDAAPGRYRGDQVDASRRLIPGATPFYVTITEPPRNANAAAAGEDRDLIREVVRANVEMTRMIAERFGGMMESAAQMMRQASDILRAADGANLPRREPQAAEAADDDDDDKDLDDEELDDGGTSSVELIKSITDQAFPLLEMWLMGRAAKPADAQAAVALATARPPSEPPVVAAPPSEPPAAQLPVESNSSAPAATPQASTASPSPVSVSSAAAAADAPPGPAVAAAEVRNAASSEPTPEQMRHLLAILNGLRPEERKVARAVVQRLSAEQRAHWLNELAALTVEQAVELVRSMIPVRGKP